MKIIIAGAGKVGTAVASQLAQEAHGITVIDNNEKELEAALEKMDITGVFGNAVNRSVLLEAKVETSDLLIALTGSDEQNLMICLIAKKLGVKSCIARVRNPEYSSVLPIIADEMGLSMSVNPERETALEITRILEFPLAKKVETFARGKVEMIDCEVDMTSPMCHKQVREVFSGMTSALVCAVERGGEVSIPLGNFCFEPGDVMTIIAPTGRMSEFFRDSGIKVQNTKRVIVSGGGKTTFYLTEQLLSQRIDVTVIEQNKDVATEFSEKLPRAEVVVGDGTDRALLESEGLAGADAFCCLTGIDEENILTALSAKVAVPGIKTIAKINRVELVPVVSPLGIGSVVSPKLIAADRVVSYVRARQNGMGSGVLTLYKIVGGKAEALEFKVKADSQVAGIPIQKLNLKKNVIIACINRAGLIISPRGGDLMLEGDTVIVVTTHAGFDGLDDILKG